MKNKNSAKLNLFPVLVLLSIVLTGCPPPVEKEPTVTTTDATSVTATSAISGGNVTDDGGVTVTQRGVCWNTSTGPIVTNNKTSDGTGTGTYSSNISGLNPGEKYYVRAYATNSVGTGYGNEIQLTTTASLSVLTTASVTAITSTTATSGGNITMDGGGLITVRGVCWGTTTGPTISNSRTTDGNGIGSFVSAITPLTPGTKYYVRAYATNSAGTSYGNELSFTALANLPTVTTTVATSISATTAASGGNVTADGGGAITARGVCWSTLQYPSIDDSKTTNGTGTGTFTSSITGLSSGTTYYVRAYATNSAGTAYGSQVTFTTSVPLQLPSLATTAATSITTSSATSGGNITSDGGTAVTSRGVCWSTSANPTTADSKTSDGTGTGSFTSSITGLIPNTIYYIRAYAANSVGTAYGSNLSFTTTAGSGSTITDIDGNTYSSVTIGNQVWMKSNLKTTKFNDGTAIPLVTDNGTWTWTSTPGYSWYNNAAANKNTYGALYNWYTVSTLILCPTGWHVPSDAEWTALTTYLGGESLAGGALKETGIIHWLSPNTGATNDNGFTALPGGFRDNYGAFFSTGIGSYWWTSSQYGSYSWYRSILYDKSNVNRSYNYRRFGFSVRCLKD